MKKTSLFFTLYFIFTNCIFAQKIEVYEPAILEIEYYRRQVTDTLNRENDFLGDDIRLRIGKNISMFYNYKNIWYDSLGCYNPELQWQIHETFYTNKKTQQDIPPFGRNLEVIYKNYKSKKLDLYYFGYNAWHYTEDMEVPKWNLLDSTKIILNYPCQLAVSQYRGRIWYAWFTLSIPISDGPWKLHGLPGLILEAYDSNKDYSFTVTGMRTEGIPDVALYNYKEREWLTTTRQQYLKTRHRDINTNQAAMYSTMYNINLEGKKNKAKPPHRNYDMEERDYHGK